MKKRLSSDRTLVIQNGLVVVDAGMRSFVPTPFGSPRVQRTASIRAAYCP